MNIFTKAIQKAQKESRRLFATILNQWDRSGDLFKSRHQADLIKQYKGWVYACVNKNANGVAAPAMEGSLYKQTLERKSSPKRRIVKIGPGRARYVNDTTYRAIRENKAVGRYVKKGMEVEEIPIHPFLDLMDAVNPHKNKWDLFFGTVSYLQLAGNSYWWMVPSGLPSASIPGRTIPAEIWLLPTQYITALKDPKKFIKGYKMKIGAAEEIFPPEEIVHFQNVNPNDMWTGMSPLEAAAVSVDIDNQKKAYTFNFFKNWAVPPVAFKLPFDKTTGKGTTWDSLKWKKFKRQWKRMHGGPENAGGMALLEGGLEIENIGFSPKEFFYLLKDKPSIEELAAIFGVPIYKLMGEGTDRRNADQDDYAWLKDTITPILKNIEQKINEQIMPVYDPNIFYVFPDIVPTDKKFRLEENEKLIHIAKTVNEVREEMGKDPVEGGDKLYIPTNLVEIGMESKGGEPEGEGKGKGKYLCQCLECGTQVSTDSHCSEIVCPNCGGAMRRAERPGPGQREVTPLEMEGFARALAARLAKKQANDALPDATKTWQEDLAEREIEGLTKVLVKSKVKFYREVIARMNSNPDGQPEAWIGNGEKLKKWLYEESEPLIALYGDASREGIYRVEQKLLTEEAAEKGIKRENKVFGSDSLPLDEVFPVAVFDIDTPEVQAQIEKIRRGFSVYPIETDIKELRKSLATGIDAGESMGDLQIRVGRSFGLLEMTPEGEYKLHPDHTYKARRIARTESLRAANYGALEGWKQSMVVRGKQWINGPSPCEFCEPMGGQVADLNHNYFEEGAMIGGNAGGKMEITYGDVPSPPLHPYCVCGLIPITYTVEEAKRNNAPVFRNN